MKICFLIFNVDLKLFENVFRLQLLSSECKQNSNQVELVRISKSIWKLKIILEIRITFEIKNQFVI